MKLVCVCGNFGQNKEQYGGQAVKTQSIYNELKKKYGSKEILKIDTYNWKENAPYLFFKCLKSIKKSKNIIILPAHKGVKVFIPLYNFLNIFSHRKLHYIVIGGWLPSMLKQNKFLYNQVKKIDYIYVETETLKKQLNSIGINNVLILKNFKELTAVKEDKNYNNISKEKNVKCCIFSRIQKEKGINDAVQVITRLNQYGYKIKLDIYGQIEKKYEKEFYHIISNNDFINYKGIVNYNESTKVLKQYDFLLFPTRYKTEGIPGTIIDAYFSGLPVIASRWESFEEVVIEGKTGLGYEILNVGDLYKKIVYVLNNLNILTEMKENCLNEAKKYTADNAMEILYKNLEG